MATFMVPAAAVTSNGAKRAPSGPEATRTDAATVNPKKLASVAPYPAAGGGRGARDDAAPALSAYAAPAAEADRARPRPRRRRGAGYAGYPAEGGSLGASYASLGTRRRIVVCAFGW